MRVIANILWNQVITSLKVRFKNYSCSEKVQKTNAEKPNVLFISIDDLNNWIEPMGGHPQSQTPNLAAFAREAVVFQNAYCASPSCNPSRTAILTGKYPFETGLYNNPQIWRHVLPDETTLMEHFQQAGYWTGGAGKIFHNNMPDPRSWNEYFPDKIQHFRTNLAGISEYKEKIKELHQFIPAQKKEFIKTKSIRWADVLDGTTKMYEE